jgi:hypothetical protein
MCNIERKSVIVCKDHKRLRDHIKIINSSLLAKSEGLGAVAH